ncbi:MAG: metallophosphoesterase [Rhodoferax sp.]|nr:metallophosphoesterase [Rhodoferax sp.]
MHRIPVFVLSMLLHAWVAWRIAPALTAFTPADLLLWGALATSALLMPLGLMGRRVANSPLSTVLVWAGLLCMGLFSTLFVMTLLRDALLVLVWAGVTVVQWLGLGGLDTRAMDALQTWSALAVLALGLLATIWGFWHARRTAQVVRVEVPIVGLPAALHGFTVAQISDIHVGPTIRQGYLQRIVTRVNALSVDLVAITGDLVDGGVRELQHHVAPLAGLVSRHGTFFVTGNHEYYSGAHAWINELRRLGVTVLINEHVVLHHDQADANTNVGGPSAKAKLVVAGVADYSAHHFDAAHHSCPATAIAGAPADAGLRLLLAHQPRSAKAAAQAGFDLQLSGHTHGGQFWPWMHLVKFQQPFTAGLNKLHELWVYTNRGTGYWGPPKRFGVPSEITHLKLVTA